jgi:hypothetical protein
MHDVVDGAALLSMDRELLPPSFTTAMALSQGVHPRDLYAWRDDGEIVQLSRGVFRRADAAPASYPDLLAVAHRSAMAIVCCRSAAALHHLSDEIPPATDAASRTFGIGPAKMSDGFVYQNLRFLGMLETWQ